MPRSLVFSAFTVTVQVAVTVGSALAAAVITAVPSWMPVTSPVEVTVATSGLLEDQRMLRSAKFQGVT